MSKRNPYSLSNKDRGAINRAIAACPALAKYVQKTEGDLRAFVDWEVLKAARLREPPYASIRLPKA